VDVAASIAWLETLICPFNELEKTLLALLAKQKRFILTAPTGSGKSTQVPQMLLNHGALENGTVVILQPRRLATRMLAARVAQERSVKLGDEVGYQIRLEDVTSSRTRIRFVTEGVLLRQMLSNALLPGVNAILFDEFHERHLYGDITLARALQIQRRHGPISSSASCRPRSTCGCWQNISTLAMCFLRKDGPTPWISATYPIPSARCRSGKSQRASWRG